MGTKVTPKPKTNFSRDDYEKLEPGDCFLLNNDLWMKENDKQNQSALSLTTGELETNLCETKVVPVDVEIKWKKKKIIKKWG